MTIQTLTLTDFLLARIADDEAMAHAAQSAGRWALAENIAVAVNNPTGHVLLDPARVLAECAAKRAIVELGWHHFGEDEYADGMEYAKEQVLRLMAAVYADHSEYRSEWAP